MTRLLAVVIVALILAPASNAARADDIASHYAGHPVHVVRGASGLDGWADQAGVIHLQDALYDSLGSSGMFKPNRPDRAWRAGFTTNPLHIDAIALHTLIHEAMHLRYPTAPEGAADCAAYLLFPDALQRYYGIGIGSARAVALWWYHPYTLDCAWFRG